MFQSVVKLIALLFVLPLALFSCEEEALPKVEESFTIEDTKYEVAKDVEILYSDSAVVRVRIIAPTLVNYAMVSSPRREFPDGILVEFFDAKKDIQSRLTAKFAVQYDLKKMIVLEDSVVVKNIKNEMMETEGLILDEMKERVYSERYMKVTTPTEVIEGYGFESDYNFQNWELKKVKGRIAAERISDDLL